MILPPIMHASELSYYSCHFSARRSRRRLTSCKPHRCNAGGQPSNAYNVRRSTSHASLPDGQPHQSADGSAAGSNGGGGGGLRGQGGSATNLLALAGALAGQQQALAASLQPQAIQMAFPTGAMGSFDMRGAGGQLGAFFPGALFPGGFAGSAPMQGMPSMQQTLSASSGALVQLLAANSGGMQLAPQPLALGQQHQQQPQQQWLPQWPQPPPPQQQLQQQQQQQWLQAAAAAGPGMPLHALSAMLAASTGQDAQQPLQPQHQQQQSQQHSPGGEP